MADNVRSEFLTKLIDARRQLKTAGPIHRRDLLKHIKRMERELVDYDRFHKGGDFHGKSAKPSTTGA